MRRARRLVTFSLTWADRAQRPDPAGARDGRAPRCARSSSASPAGPKEREALTVGRVNARTLVQKGQLAFVQAAGELPDVRFTLAGGWLDGSVERLRDLAAANVRLTGWLPRRSSRPATGAPPSTCKRRSTGASAWRWPKPCCRRCVPVVMNVTAMPEVVGDAGVLIESQRAEDVAAGVRQALELGPRGGGRAARERILGDFTMERRREGILRVVEEALDG